MSDAAQLKRDLQGRMLEICQYLLPGGKKRGQEYRCGSIRGGEGHSFSVHLGGAKSGTWAEFNGGVGDERGDVFELIQAIRGGSFVEALDWSRDYLGLERPVFHAVAKRDYKRPVRPASVHVPRGGSEVFDYLTATRKLTAETLRAYQIAEGQYPEWGGELAGQAAIVFPYKRASELVMVKWLALERPDGKKAITTTKDAEPCLFGWQAIPDDARAVVICEGEIDAATWYQVGFPALAPPRGTGSSDWIDVEYPNLERFEIVYLAFDNDEAGRKAAERVAPRFGDRTRLVAHLDSGRYGKDANAWLVAGATAEQFAELIRTAKDVGPAELRSPADFEAEVLERFYPTGDTPAGAEPPFGKIAGRVRFRPSEVSIWTGYNHHGKTTALSYLTVSAAYQGERVCLAMLEETPPATVEHLLRQATGERCPRPTRVSEGLVWLADRFLIWDHRTAAVKPERLFEVFSYARRRYGCSQFVVDNLAMLGIGEDDYNRQKDVMVAALTFASQTAAHLHIVAHPRKGHDESEPPGKLDVRGGAVLTDLAHNVFCHWRNVEKGEKLAQLEADSDPAGEIPGLVESEPDAIWAVRKQRETGETPMVKLWFDRGSLQFHEQSRQTPFRYCDVAMPEPRHDERGAVLEFPQFDDDGNRPF